MKTFSYLIMIILAVGFASCSKDGSEGPLGPRGERGDRGADGKTVLNGASDPASSVGTVGDFYINTNSYVLYGPKTASGWGSGKSILGATGARGATGAKGDKGEAGYVILSGGNDPTNAIGNTGDFYFNTTTKTLFFKNWELDKHRQIS